MVCHPHLQSNFRNMFGWTSLSSQEYALVQVQFWKLSAGLSFIPSSTLCDHRDDKSQGLAGFDISAQCTSICWRADLDSTDDHLSLSSFSTWTENWPDRKCTMMVHARSEFQMHYQSITIPLTQKTLVGSHISCQNDTNHWSSNEIIIIFAKVTKHIAARIRHWLESLRCMHIFIDCSIIISYGQLWVCVDMKFVGEACSTALLSALYTKQWSLATCLTQSRY